MGTPAGLAIGYDRADSIDPRLTPVDGPKGCIYRFVPAVGPAVLLQKQDNGPTTNWTLVGGGGGTPTGNPLDVAFFDAGGNLSYSDLFKFDPVISGLWFGSVAPGGTIAVTAPGSFAGGSVDTSGILSSVSFVFGSASNGGDITANAIGSTAFGSVNAASIQANSEGAFVSGTSVSGGQLYSSGTGSFAFGFVSDNPSLIIAANNGAFAGGSAVVGGNIASNGNGSIAFGFAANAGTLQALAEGFVFGYADNGIIQSMGQASWAIGYVENNGLINSLEQGSFAGGNAINGNINSYARGSFVYGTATNQGIIEAFVGGNQGGSTALGFADGNQSIITTHSIPTGNRAAFVQGCAIAGGQITSGAEASVAFGYAIALGTQIKNQSKGSFVHGIATVNNARLTVDTGIGNFVHGFMISGVTTTITGTGCAVFLYESIGLSAISGTACFAFGSNHTLGSSFVTAFGQGINSANYLSSYFGRFPTIPPISAGWVSTDPLFALGNGSSNASRSNAFQVDKDARVTTSASLVNKAIRKVTINSVLDARLDHTILANSTAGVITLTLPSGVDGLEFYIKDYSPTGVSQGTNVVSDGVNIFDEQVGVFTLALNGDWVHLKFLGNSWFVFRP